MRRINFQNKLEEWGRFRRGLFNCLLWWGIGAGIGLLFAAALDGEMQSTLAQHLETGVDYLLDENPAPLTYFLKRCLTYTQMLLVVWGLEYFTYGYIGVRVLLLSRGFLYGFGQVAWVMAYGIKGICLGIVAYWPHNLLFIIASAWLEWMMHGRIFSGRFSARQTAAVTACMVPVIAMVEAYGAPAMFRYFI